MSGVGTYRRKGRAAGSVRHGPRGRSAACALAWRVTRAATAAFLSAPPLPSTSAAASAEEEDIDTGDGAAPAPRSRGGVRGGVRAQQSARCGWRRQCGAPTSSSETDWLAGGGRGAELAAFISARSTGVLDAPPGAASWSFFALSPPPTTSSVVEITLGSASRRRRPATPLPCRPPSRRRPQSSAATAPSGQVPGGDAGTALPSMSFRPSSCPLIDGPSRPCRASNGKTGASNRGPRPRWTNSSSTWFGERSGGEGGG